MELYLDNLDLSKYKKTARYALKYIVDNDIPIKIYYVGGTVDEGVYLKAMDSYNYFILNPETKTSSMVHKANVLKVEVMGDLVQGLLETRAKKIEEKIKKAEEKDK